MDKHTEYNELATKVRTDIGADPSVLPNLKHLVQKRATEMLELPYFICESHVQARAHLVQAAHSGDFEQLIAAGDTLNRPVCRNLMLAEVSECHTKAKEQAHA